MDVSFAAHYRGEEPDTVGNLTWKFAEDRRTLFDRELYQNHLLFLPPACKNALANFPCVFDPLRLKASDNITLTIHVQHGYRSTTHLPCLAARYGKDIPGAKTHAQAVEGNDRAIGKLEPFRKGRIRMSGHIRSFHSVVSVFLSAWAAMIRSRSRCAQASSSCHCWLTSSIKSSATAL